MRKKLKWNAAAAVVMLAVMTTTCYPQIGAVKRAQAPQVGNKVVALGTTRSMGDRTVARVDDGARTALNSLGFNGALQGARFGEARVAGCGRWGCGTNSPIAAGAAIVAEPNLARPARRHVAPQLAQMTALANSSFKVGLRSLRFGETK